MLKQFLIRLLFYYKILSDTPRAVEDALRERWYTPLLYGCRILLNLMLFSTITLLSVLTAFSSPLLLPVSDPPVPEKEGLELSVQELPNQKDTKSEKLNITETKVENKEKIWKCKGCNQTETYALNFLQKQGIKDKNALATIMGNIKQESGFVPNICEGGARIKYESCRSGGYGLIQWTHYQDKRRKTSAQRGQRQARRCHTNSFERR